MMRKSAILALLLCLCSLGAAQAVIVRPAPEIQWVDAAGKSHQLSKFKGQPVIVLIAPTPRSWAFRSQVGQLQKMYQRYAAERVICIAAFTQEPGVIHSNIPFVVATDGPRVGYEYQSETGFGIALIGRDGNLDYLTGKVLPAQRIYDLLDASFVTQELLRRR